MLANIRDVSMLSGGELVEKSTSVMHPTISNNEPTQEPANDPAAVDTAVATPSPTIDPPSNVIVFGESGVGKSSVINMLMGEPVAAVSNEAAGCTYKSNKFRTTIDGREVMLYDTAGLDEAEAGTVSPERAIQNLRSLVKDLKTVNLLVYCIRGIRFRTIVADNYNIFRNTICGSNRKVPIVLVITGLENEDNMDDWWENNKEYFDQYNLKFCGHACITATKGRAFKDQQGYIFEDLYKDSKEKVTRLLANHAFKSSITIFPPERPRYPDPHARASDAPGIGTSLLLGLFCLPVRWASDTYEYIMSEAQNGE
jgi:GTPase SAR1 family protein